MKILKELLYVYSVIFLPYLATLLIINKVPSKYLPTGSIHNPADAVLLIIGIYAFLQIVLISIIRRRG